MQKVDSSPLLEYLLLCEFISVELCGKSDDEKSPYHTFVQFVITEECYSEWSEEVRVAKGHILNLFCSKALQSKGMVQN